MSNRRGKSSKKQKDDSQSSEEKLIVDPYEIIATPVCVCSPEGWHFTLEKFINCCSETFLFIALCFTDHIRKKNCAKNPWCLFGLGEKEGIWRNSNTAINSLGLDPNVYLRKRDPKQLKDEVLYPPAGLRNLGATCYLNVLIQVHKFSSALVLSHTSTNNSPLSFILPQFAELVSQPTRSRCRFQHGSGQSEERSRILERNGAGHFGAADKFRPHEAVPRWRGGPDAVCW